MSRVQIFNHNWLFDEVIVSTTASSQKTGFPVKNLNDYQRRSKVWRSDGFWQITTDDNQIIFREQVGVNMLAVIAEDDYASTTLLLAAIKTALEIAGANTYTVAIDASTGRIKITSNGSYFSLITTDADFTAADLLGFTTSADRTGSLSYTADSLKISTGEYIQWDLGTGRNPKAFLAIGERNSDIKLSPTAIITLEANIVNDFTAPPYAVTLPYNRHILAVTDDTQGLVGTDAYRYWRLSIEDPANIYGQIELSAVYLGDLWMAERGAVKFPYTERPVDLSSVSYSESGHATVYRRQKTATLDVEWSFLSALDFENLSEIWDSVGTTDPFFINLDPGVVFSVDRNRHFKLVRFASEPRFTLTSPGVWNADMTLREEI